MKFILNFYILIFILSCAKDENPQQIQTQGFNMLLIGNSFFKPYADHLNNLASEANLNEHNSTVVKRGGEYGWPINLWNDSTTEEHQLIKSTLDQGNIEIFGMTSGYDIDSDNPTEGHSAWIRYPLQNNPNIIIFVAIGSFDFPNGDSNGTRPDWDTFASDNGFNSIQEFYEYYINEVIHKEIVDELRLEFPFTKIFTIPTGWATKNLAQMNLDSQLLDDISMVGPKSNSIFTDEKGHQGQIVIETGTMIWLNSIYNVDLSSFNYDTGFTTDLHAIAQDIIDSHDSNYKF
ncbi:MAG: hypothetical protein P8H45_02640 [Flavobacteriaceae bacterium]|nr:hypothetical protein [Flavobacteriaceae bacterium]